MNKTNNWKNCYRHRNTVNRKVSVSVECGDEHRQTTKRSNKSLDCSTIDLSFQHCLTTRKTSAAHKNYSTVQYSTVLTVLFLLNFRQPTSNHLQQMSIRVNSKCNNNKTIIMVRGVLFSSGAVPLQKNFKSITHGNDAFWWNFHIHLGFHEHRLNIEAEVGLKSEASWLSLHLTHLSFFPMGLAANAAPPPGR